MFKKLAQQLANNKQTVLRNVTTPIEKNKSRFLKGLSKYALELYVKKTDVKNFTKLALSDPQDLSHNSMTQNLFQNNNTLNPFETEDEISKLSQNEKFLKDLGLDE